MVHLLHLVRSWWMRLALQWPITYIRDALSRACSCAHRALVYLQIEESARTRGVPAVSREEEARSNTVDSIIPKLLHIHAWHIINPTTRIVY